jgi:hypothetical protein
MTSLYLRLSSVALFLLLAFPAEAQTPLPLKIPLSENVTITERDSNPWRKYGYPGDTLALPNGQIINLRDLQFGTYHPEQPSMLNGDIGAGNAQDMGILNLGADVSKAVRIQATGITVFRAQAGRIKVCDDQGCFDLMRALRKALRPTRVR